MYKGDFHKLELFLTEWCCLSNEEINDLKTNLVCDKALSFCISYIKNNKWSLVEELLDWSCYLKDDREKLTKEFADNEACDLCIYLIKTQSLEDIDKFLNWCFSSKTKLNNFKKETLTAKREIVCSELVYEGKFDAADAFLNLCCFAVEEISSFKKDLLFSDKGLEMCSNFLHGYDDFDIDKKVLFAESKDLLKDVIQWFYQPREILLQFKDKLSTYCGDYFDTYDIETLLELLGECINSEEEDMDD